jgi:glucosamine-6-phosphate deaminase
MDEFLDWQGREIPEDHPFSFRGYCQKHLYDLLDDDLLPSPENIIYPTMRDIDGFSERIVTEGGLDTAFAGFGYRGHVAFNEPPSDRWHKYSVEELAQSKTRVVPLLQDTLVAHSHRTTGGYTQAIPPMALTVGMADFLGARRIRLLTDGGAWKQYITRIVTLTTERDVEYPVTLVHGHPNVDIALDALSAAPLPLGLHP